MTYCVYRKRNWSEWACSFLHDFHLKFSSRFGNRSIFCGRCFLVCRNAFGVQKWSCQGHYLALPTHCNQFSLDRCLLSRFLVFGGNWCNRYESKNQKFEIDNSRILDGLMSEYTRGHPDKQMCLCRPLLAIVRQCYCDAVQLRFYPVPTRKSRFLKIPPSSPS